MKRYKPKIQKGDIYYADLGAYNGSKQGGYRPVIIIQNNVGNDKSSTTIVSPITSKLKTPIHTHVKFIHKLKLQTVLLEQIFTINISDLCSKLGSVDKNTLQEIDKKIKISLGIQDC